MYYIRRTPEGLLVDKGYHSTIIQKGLKQYLNELLIEEHATLEGRMKALKKKYGLKNNVPIYIHEDCCLYTTKSLREHDTVCINYHRVLSIRQTDTNQSEIIFKNLTILKLPIPHATMVRKHMQTSHFLEKLS